MGLRVLQLPQRLWTCSHPHRQLCLPLLLLRSPLHLWPLPQPSLAQEPKVHIPAARLLVNPHLCAPVPAIRFPIPTSRNRAFRSPLLRTIRMSSSSSRFGPRYFPLPLFPLRPQTCAGLSEATGQSTLRIFGSTSLRHLLRLLCLPQTLARILILPPGAAGS